MSVQPGSPLDLILGRLIVGVETDPDDPMLTRVYLDARYQWCYILVAGDDALAVERAWRGGAGHLTTRLRDGAAVYVDEEARDAVLRYWTSRKRRYWTSRKRPTSLY